MTDLIITNGDSAADLLAAAGKSGTILPWQDVLHEGPIVLDLARSAAVRAPFLARRFGMSAADISAGFAERDAVVAAHADFDRIELWFEHDVFDQLQLLQILAYFADVGRSDGLILVQADDFLGTQTPQTILKYAAGARPLTGDDLDFAERLWADLAMPTPERVLAALNEDDGSFPLPYAAPALWRFLAELPSAANGLGRTEVMALRSIQSGQTQASAVFRAVLAAEEAAFMGDWSFFHLLDDLAFCDVPLIAGLDGHAGADDTERFQRASLKVTEVGGAVLAGRGDHVLLSAIDRWWAGTRLQGRDVWRYDERDRKLVPPEAFGA